MKHLKRKITIGVIFFIIAVCATGAAIFAAVDEYKVEHSITIDLGGGKCTDIYYESQEDRGPNAGKWFKDLRVGEYLADKYGKYHTIKGYNASVPKDGTTVSNYYDCVGVTPYVRINGVYREGYIFEGWEVYGAGKSYNDFGAAGVRVDIGAYTDKNITIKAKWKRCDYDVKVNIFYLSDNEEWKKEESYNSHARMNIDINGQREKNSVYEYSEKITGDSIYSISVNTNPGWKVDGDCSGEFSGTVLADVIVNIYIRPIVYEVHLYGNKPQDASGNLENRSAAGWQWDESGYYKRMFVFDRTGELPEVSDIYGISGWTGTCWKKNDDTLIMPYKNARNTLSYTDGDIVNLNAVWKENSYSIGIDVNGGYGNDTIIVTGYEQDNHLPNELLRPGYNLDSWNSDRDGDGTRYEKGAVVSKLVDDDGGIYNIYAQWSKKKRICLKVSSSIYNKELINDSVYNNDKNWFDEYGIGGSDGGRNVPDDKCIQIWTVNDQVITQIR